MSSTTPQEHYQEAERLMDEADEAIEAGKYAEADSIARAAQARATIAIAAAVSDVARALVQRPGGR